MPQTHRQVLLDTAKECGWGVNRSLSTMQWYDLELDKGDDKLQFRFDRRDRIWSYAHHRQQDYGERGKRWERVDVPDIKKLDYAVKILRGQS